MNTHPVNLLELPLEEKYLVIEALFNQVKPIKNLQERLDFLNQLQQVQSFLDKTPALRTFLDGAFPECDYAIKTILAIGQGPIVFNSIEGLEDRFDKLRILLHTLLEVEHFYDAIGGIMGYYYTFLKLLVERKNTGKQAVFKENYYRPAGLNLEKSSKAVVNKYVKEGIQGLPLIAEVFPIGGAGDRLNFCDSDGDPLPAAQLPFGGISLLEGLIRDVQAKEFLYWKLNNIQIVTPIVMMGSHEKNNISHLLNLCQEKKWFGRAPDSFQMLVQPLVPQITEKGDFSLSEFLKFTLKPGGHGAIWKLAEDGAVFDWLKQRGRSKLLLRQINNPVIGIDDFLLAFIGVGIQGDKTFGFTSCERLLNSSEGMLVLKEKKIENSYAYSIVNVEYTDFQAKGIKDAPEKEGGKYSVYSSNINALFADIEKIQQASKQTPLPGLLINTKKKAPYIDEEGSFSYIPSGRLESTMQNIADCIVDTYPEKINPENSDLLSSYIVYNQRIKSLSVTKNEYIEGKSLQDTPHGAKRDLLINARNLFVDHCSMQIPQMNDEDDYIENGPSFLIDYHPALGPLYSVIGQKIKGGSIAENSMLELNIAEAHITNLTLAGTLKITAKDSLGLHEDGTGKIFYSNAGGKCELFNVKVSNKGIDKKAENNSYWSHDIAQQELMEIVLHGNGEFFADAVEFCGSLRIEIPDGYRVEASMVNGKIEYKTLRIDEPTWHWKYAYGEDDSIVLTKAK